PAAHYESHRVGVHLLGRIRTPRWVDAWKDRGALLAWATYEFCQPAQRREMDPRRYLDPVSPNELCHTSFSRLLFRQQHFQPFRRARSQCGKDVWSMSRTYWDGSETTTQITLVMRKLDAGANEIRFNTLRGFYCQAQSTTNLSVPFADELGGPTLALDSSITL